VGAVLLARYQAVPTATAPRAIRVEGSDKKPTRDEGSDIFNGRVGPDCLLVVRMRTFLRGEFPP
jgi:hypothetical protein